MLTGAANRAIELIRPEQLGRIDEIIDGYRARPSYLIPVLKEAQDLYGYLPVEVQDRIADGLGLSPSHVYGVVTFYSFFTLTPRGRNTARVCLGTACYVKGSKEILEKISHEFHVGVKQTSEDGRFTVEAVRCLGACGLAPVMMVNGHAHGNIKSAHVGKILEVYK